MNLEQYSQRYADNWTSTSRRARASLANRCANCWIRKSTCAHHMMYRDLIGRVKGREVPGWHVVPLCDRCHDPKWKRPGSAHYKENWIYDRQDGLWGNRNSYEYVFWLRLKYWALWAIVKCFRLVFR